MPRKMYRPDDPSVPITGTPEDDVIRGTNRADIIDAGSGDDVVYGKRGDDDIRGGQDSDVVYAGNGDDVVVADEPLTPGTVFGDDTVFGGKGNDTINVLQGEDVVDGGEGDDFITLNSQLPGIPELPDGTDTVLFEYGPHGKSFGHDTINFIQGDDVLVFLDRSGKTESLEDLSAQTRLVDIGQDAYRIEWLNADQSVTLLFPPIVQEPGPEPQPDVDNFTTLEELAQVVEFRFDYDFA